MAGGGKVRLGENTEMRGEVIEKAFGWSMKAHKSPDKPYLVEKIRRYDPPEVIICFPGSGAVKDWYSQKNFGETKINLDRFGSLRSIGNDEAALVNEAFLKRFEDILVKPSLEAEVENAINKKRQIVFAGHSSGAPVAILATLWALEKYQTPKSHGGIPPLCVTFGSPLVGNHIFSHATRRENWSRYFVHYVMRYDIVPRILLAPLSSLDQTFEPISQSFNPKSRTFMSESVGRASAAATSDFYFAIMSNAATVTSHAASKLMGSTDTTLDTLANFIPLSPYRPFGTYVFCTGNGRLGKQIVIRNPDAVLQVLFFSAQLSTEAEAAQVPIEAYEIIRFMAPNCNKWERRMLCTWINSRRFLSLKMVLLLAALLQRLTRP
ncbi:EDS1 protein [Spatholobus suberectus]|nr:EDS1 protein [Spatholobus suberectus]